MTGLRADLSALALLGWNENTARCLEAVAHAGFGPVVAVVPDGFDAAPLRAAAARHGVEVREATTTTPLRALIPEATVVASASWPFVIRPADLERWPDAVLNVHGAALPRWRGPHPLNHALLADDPTVGVTVHLVTPTLDTGDILLQSHLPIADEDTLLDVRSLVHREGARLLVQVLQQLAHGRAQRRPQDDAAATIATRRRPEDGRLDWQQPARALFALVRAAGRPGPGAFTDAHGATMRIWSARVEQGAAPDLETLPGTVISVTAASAVVQCGDGRRLRLLERDAVPLSPGDRLGR